MILITLTVTGALSTWLINDQFDQYLKDEHGKIMSRIWTDMEDVIGGTSKKTIEEVGLYVISVNHFLEVMDVNGQILYESENISNQNMMGRRLTLTQMQNIPMYRNLQIDSVILKDKEQNQYLISIGYDSSFGSSEDASRFKTTLYYSMLIAMVISLLIGFVLSVYLARPISEGIQQVAETADNIAKGRRDEQFIEGHPILELIHLNQSMNQMATTIAEQEDIRRDLVETISHEVKTPITILKSQIEAFLDGVFKPNEEKLLKCHDEIIRLESLMTQMEDIHESSFNNYVMTLSQFDIKEEIENICQILEPQFQKKNIVIHRLDISHLMVEIDRYKLRQVMYNVLSNAYKFSDDNSSVTIKSSITEDRLTVIIKNKGLIIPFDEHEKIFEPHYRLSSSNQYDPHGKGLGLKITKNLLTFMGGTIELVKSDVDETVFTFELPISDMNGLLK